MPRTPATELMYDFIALCFAVLAVIGCAVWAAWMLIRDSVNLAVGWVVDVWRYGF